MKKNVIQSIPFGDTRMCRSVINIEPLYLVTSFTDCFSALSKDL